MKNELPDDFPAVPGGWGRATLAVLIVNWNSKDFLRQCLKSVFATSAGRVDEIIVVDGGSFDGCREMLASEFPDVRFIQCEENVGFGRANNIGFEQVSADLLLLLNPDTEMKEGALDEMVRHFGRLADCGMVAPRILNTDGSLQTSCVQAYPTALNQILGSDVAYRLFPGWKLWGKQHAFGSNVPVVVPTVSGACMLMKAQSFREVGGFSPEYFMYGEDVDLCAKIARCGLKVYHVPGALVVHHGGGCSACQTSNFSAVLLRESTFRFIRSHRGGGAAVVYRVSMGFGAAVRLAVLGVAWLFSAGRRREDLVASRRKWAAVLRWSVGLEGWAARKSDSVRAMSGKAERALR